MENQIHEVCADALKVRESTILEVIVRRGEKKKDWSWKILRYKSEF